MKQMRTFTFSLLASLVSLSAHAENSSAPADAAYIRAATGDITLHGGARRLTGDQTEALKASLRNSTAKKRHPADRRRHGRLGNHRRAQPGGRGRRLF
ncbi:hypothetical protein OJE16_17410 [Pantoea tagorei]